MKAMIRRLVKLEAAFGPEIETPETRRLRQRIEEGRRRVAAMRGEPAVRSSFDPHLGLEELLQAGRMRNARGAALT